MAQQGKKQGKHSKKKKKLRGLEHSKEYKKLARKCCHPDKRTCKNCPLKDL